MLAAIVAHMRTDWNPPVAPGRVRLGDSVLTGPRVDDPTGAPERPVSLGYRTLRAVDPVTGLGNARCWSQRAGLMQCDAYWRCEPVTLLAVDIDQFAQINDEYGHPAGDDVLRSVGELLRRATRPTDLVCRCVADEFLVLAPGRDAGAALELAGRIRDHARLLITTAMASADWFVTITDVTVSVGVAVGHDLATNDLLARARRALEHTKGYGQDLICLADSDSAANGSASDPDPGADPGAAADPASDSAATASDRSLTRQALSATTCRLD